MPITIAKIDDGRMLSHPGKRSLQIVDNARFPAAGVTITRVTMGLGAVSARHAHATAKQISLIERGKGRLLMKEGGTLPLTEGDVVRTPPGEVHGVENTGAELLVYLTVTSPPEDMIGYYADAGTPA